MNVFNFCLILVSMLIFGIAHTQDFSGTQGRMSCYYAHEDSVLKAETDHIFGYLDYETTQVSFELNIRDLKCNESKVSRFIHLQEDSIALYKGKLLTPLINPNEPGTKTIQTEGYIYFGGKSRFVEGTATLSHISNEAYYYGILSFRLNIPASELGLQALFPRSGEMVHLEIDLGVFTRT